METAIIEKCKRDLKEIEEGLYSVEIRGKEYKLRRLKFENVIRAEEFSNKMNYPLEEVLTMRSLVGIFFPC
jgi:hypothetical protein